MKEGLHVLRVKRLVSAVALYFSKLYLHGQGFVAAMYIEGGNFGNSS